MIIHSTTLDTMEKVINIYGGSGWIKIEGMFLLGQSDKYAIGSTGGEATHTLTVQEMPKHNHNSIIYESKGTPADQNYAFATLANWWNEAYGNHGRLLEITENGGSKAHNNMPPYKTVYIWERTQ